MNSSQNIQAQCQKIYSTHKSLPQTIAHKIAAWKYKHLFNKIHSRDRIQIHVVTESNTSHLQINHLLFCSLFC